MALILDPDVLPSGLVNDYVGNYVPVNPNCEGCEDPTGVLAIEAVFPVLGTEIAWVPVGWERSLFGEFPPPDGAIELTGQESFYTAIEEVCVEQGCSGVASAPDVVALTNAAPAGEPATVKRWWTLVPPDSAMLASAIQVEVRAVDPLDPLPRIQVIAVYDDATLTGTPETDWDTEWRPAGWSDLGIYAGGVAEVFIDGVAEEAYAECLDYDSRVRLESDGCFPVVKGGTGVWVGVIVDCDAVDAAPIEIVVNRVGFESH